MSFQFIEVSTPEVILDRAAVERDDGYIYEHLKRYCSKFTPLPAITVEVIDGRLVTTRGHKYLSIARELGHPKIRAVLNGVTFEELRKQGVPGLISVVSKEALESEQKTTVVNGWHVFFFKFSPSPDLAAQVDAHFRSFLSKSLPGVLGGNAGVTIESQFDLSGPCFEIKFPTPVANQPWAGSYHAFISSVSREMLSIESYQGRRFTV